MHTEAGDVSCPWQSAPEHGLTSYRLEKRRRNEHILGCLRKERAQTEGLPEQDVHYCRRCFQWVAGWREWAGHCATHLKDLRTKWCAPQVYCHTLLWAGICCQCAGDGDLPPEERLREYDTDALLWAHTDGHLQQFGRAARCDYPLCNRSEFETVLSLRYHLIDSHRYRPRFIGAGVADEGDPSRFADLDGELADLSLEEPQGVGDFDLQPESGKFLPPARVQKGHRSSEPLQIVLWSPTERMKSNVSPAHTQTVCPRLLDQDQTATPSRESSCVHTPPTSSFAHSLNVTDEEMEDLHPAEFPSRPKDDLTSIDWSLPVDRAADTAMFSDLTCIDSLAEDAALAPSSLEGSVPRPGTGALGEHVGAQKPKILLRLSQHPAQRRPQKKKEKESHRKSTPQPIGATKLKLTLHCKPPRIQKRRSRQQTQRR